MHGQMMWLVCELRQPVSGAVDTADAVAAAAVPLPCPLSPLLLITLWLALAALRRSVTPSGHAGSGAWPSWRVCSPTRR